MHSTVHNFMRANRLYCAAFFFPLSVPSLNGSSPASALAAIERADQSRFSAPRSTAFKRFCLARSTVGRGVGCPSSSPRERMCPASGRQQSLQEDDDRLSALPRRLGLHTLETSLDGKARVAE